MVFVKVRETYDLQTVKNKMTVIGVHAPRPEIIKANFPGLLMQCKAYRPYSCDVRVACASVLPLDPLGVGTADGDVAPEDVFNPILYKATTNVGMSQIEARIQAISLSSVGTNGTDVNGNTASVDVDTVTGSADEFAVYYGLLSNAHGWKHANPQSGFQMTGLKPLVYEMLYNVGDSNGAPSGSTGNPGFSYPNPSGTVGQLNFSGAGIHTIRGNAKPVPFMNCTAYVNSDIQTGFSTLNGENETLPANAENVVPWINCLCGCIIVPPSKLHSLFYRMVVEWTIEFSSIRPIGEITNWTGLERIASNTYFQNYSYGATKEALTGDSESIMDNDAAMVSANVDIKKVM